MDYVEGENHVIDKPRDYDFWRCFQPPGWPNPLLNWVSPDPRTLEPTEEALFPGTDKYPLFITAGSSIEPISFPERIFPI